MNLGLNFVQFLDVLPSSYPPGWYKRTLRVLRLLCGSCGVLPTSYTFEREVTLLDEHPFVHSHSADVFRGISGGEMVAEKALTVYLSDKPGRLNKVIFAPLHSACVLLSPV